MQIDLELCGESEGKVYRSLRMRARRKNELVNVHLASAGADAYPGSVGVILYLRRMGDQNRNCDFERELRDSSYGSKNRRSL